MHVDLLRLMSEDVESKRALRKSRVRAPCRLGGKPSKGAIPACTPHVVDVMPYAAMVEAELSARVDEAKALEQGRRADPHGRLADELHDMLGIGPLRYGEVCRLLSLSLEGLERLARAMQRAGRITLTRRGRSMEMRRAEDPSED